jgi:peptidoglycan/LPS O-acetylase OafA/YrhL
MRIMSIWSRARDLAAQTPGDRNRYVDFLRAVSILAVITGHWLIAALYYHDGSLIPGDLLEIQSNTQWLTWLFQVMPIFFIVGGYANAVTLEKARQREIGYAGWLAARLNRLVTPLLALLLGWALLAAILYFMGVSGDVTRLASRTALIPTWFLAIYIMVVVLAPATYIAWRRWGFASFWALAAISALVDIAFFAADLRWMGWSNYLWIWLSVHHLGYAWRDGRMGSPARLVIYSALGLLALGLMVSKGPYPFAMAGSPDEGISNSFPPKLTLLMLGITQFGLLLAIEGPMRRILTGSRLWAATVLINSMIMTLYLWHLTVMVIIIALAYLAGGLGLGLEPGSADWWITRPIWIAVLLAAVLPVTLLLSPLERRAHAADAAAPAASRLVGGAALLCLGVALLALFGFGSAPLPWLDIAAFLMVVAGAAISGLLPGLK